MVNGYIKDNIAAALIPPKIPQKETRFLSGEELQIIFEQLHKRLNQACGLRDFVIIALMATLGLRKGTVVALDVDDIDLQFGRIFIREKGQNQKRSSLIPLVILELLQEYITANHLSSGPLFLSVRKRRLPADYVNKIVKRLKQELLAEGHNFAQHLHPHIFRHAAATQATMGSNRIDLKLFEGFLMNNNLKTVSGRAVIAFQQYLSSVQLKLTFQNRYRDTG